MITDELTGLPTRNEFISYLSNLELGATENESCLAFIDIDTFIWINDQFGHLHGDQILKDIGRLIQLETKANGTLPFRVGGEEFAIVGINMELQRFSWLMQKLQHAISKQNFEYKCDNPNRKHLTVSVGIHPIPKLKIDNARALLAQLADRVYEEKQSQQKYYEAFYAPDKAGT